MADGLEPCPNGSCEHGGWVHDIYEPGDPYPTCCISTCRCGHPGDAELREHAGTVTVVRADPVIRVSRELLDTAKPEFWNGEVLTLDTAGEYRYRYLRPDPRDPRRASIFGREKS